MRPIDATRLVKLVLEERDKIPLKLAERYSFGVQSPNKHGASMRVGIRKVLRLIEQAPTLDYAPVKRGEWWRDVWEDETVEPHKMRYAGYRCSRCFFGTAMKRPYCSNCGARMDGKENA